MFLGPLQAISIYILVPIFSSRKFSFIIYLIVFFGFSFYLVLVCFLIQFLFLRDLLYWSFVYQSYLYFYLFFYIKKKSALSILILTVTLFSDCSFDMANSILEISYFPKFLIIDWIILSSVPWVISLCC